MSELNETVDTMRKQTLEMALQYVTADRQATHGKPEDTFGRIAGYWSVYLDKTVSAYDVAALMALLKIARSQANPTAFDNWVDLAGYAACGSELALEGLASDVEA